MLILAINYVDLQSKCSLEREFLMLEFFPLLSIAAYNWARHDEANSISVSCDIYSRTNMCIRCKVNLIKIYFLLNSFDRFIQEVLPIKLDFRQAMQSSV